MKSRGLVWIPILGYSALICVLSSFQRNPGGGWADAGGDKILHFGAYGLWALLLALPILRTWPGLSDRLLAVWLSVAGAVFGASDELHQSYVPGRDASFGDLLADSLGALCGALALICLRRLWRRRDAPGSAESAGESPGPPNSRETGE